MIGSKQAEHDHHSQWVSGTWVMQFLHFLQFLEKLVKYHVGFPSGVGTQLRNILDPPLIAHIVCERSVYQPVFPAPPPKSTERSK